MWHEFDRAEQLSAQIQKLKSRVSMKQSGHALINGNRLQFDLLHTVHTADKLLF